MDNDKLLSNRIDIMLVYDATNCNPNGDPDMDNEPRQNIINNHGLVSDVCLKYLIRRTIEQRHEGEQGYTMFVRPRTVKEETYGKFVADETGLTLNEAQEAGKKLPANKLNEAIRRNFYDIRAFGGAMTTAQNYDLKGVEKQITGPVQVEFGESLDAIAPQEIPITCCAIASVKESEEGKESTMGAKQILPYALYTQRLHISGHQAERAGFTEKDLEYLIEALRDMFELNRSASRSGMVLRKLYLFRHADKYGKAPAHVIFDTIKFQKHFEGPYPTSYADYEITVDEDAIPEGVTLTKVVDY